MPENFFLYFVFFYHILTNKLRQNFFSNLTLSNRVRPVSVAHKEVASCALVWLDGSVCSFVDVVPRRLELYQVVWRD
jgi:hypothetical protein